MLRQTYIFLGVRGYDGGMRHHFSAIRSRKCRHEGSVIHGVKMPHGYRERELVGLAHEAGALDHIRAILGKCRNDQGFSRRDASSMALPLPG